MPLGSTTRLHETQRYNLQKYRSPSLCRGRVAHRLYRNRLVIDTVAVLVDAP
jgi:hypothetical protein